MTFQQKFGMAITSGALATLLLAGSAFASTNTIKGNGPHSHNKIVNVSKVTTTVTQSSETEATTTIVLDSNTGGNKVKGNTNTDGGSSVKTGKIITTITVTNSGSTNTISL